MAKLTEVVNFLDKTLSVDSTPDYSAAHNGLQLENDGEVRSVVAAVDASEAVIQKAVDVGAELLIVHHGMFWHGVQKVTNAFYRKLKLAMDHNLAIYSSHLHLDVHPEYGNNALLANALGMGDAQPYGDFKGAPLGLKQELSMTLPELLSSVSKAVNCDVHHCPGGKNEVGMVGIVTGGAGSEVEKMHTLGIQTFITGEGPHWSFPLAEELGMNVIYAGHYATETFGVIKMAEVVAEKFQMIEKQFIDHPTGL